MESEGPPSSDPANVYMTANRRSRASLLPDQWTYYTVNHLVNTMSTTYYSESGCFASIRNGHGLRLW